MTAKGPEAFLKSVKGQLNKFVELNKKDNYKAYSCTISEKEINKIRANAFNKANPCI